MSSKQSKLSAFSQLSKKKQEEPINAKEEPKLSEVMGKILRSEELNAIYTFTGKFSIKLRIKAITDAFDRFNIVLAPWNMVFVTPSSASNVEGVIWGKDTAALFEHSRLESIVKPTVSASVDSAVGVIDEFFGICVVFTEYVFSLISSSSTLSMSDISGYAVTFLNTQLPTLNYINKPTKDQLMLIIDKSNFNIIRNNSFGVATISTNSLVRFLDSGSIFVFPYNKSAAINQLAYGAPVFVCEDNSSSEAALGISNYGDINGVIEEFLDKDLVTITISSSKKPKCSCYRSMRHLVDTLKTSSPSLSINNTVKPDADPNYSIFEIAFTASNFESSNLPKQKLDFVVTEA